MIASAPRINLILPPNFSRAVPKMKRNIKTTKGQSREATRIRTKKSICKSKDKMGETLFRVTKVTRVTKVNKMILSFLFNFKNPKSAITPGNTPKVIAFSVSGLKKNKVFRNSFFPLQTGKVSGCSRRSERVV